VARPPGLLALFGSGETSPSGRAAHQFVFERLGRPIDAAILGTPAGFETNARQVVERIRQFLQTSLQNYTPNVVLVHAPRNDRAGGTNDGTALAELLQSNYLFAGPGSPTYAVRHLRDSVALSYLDARWRSGAALVAASAAAIALGRHAIPVYEIFKAGQDAHWSDGLDLLGPLGYELAVVPHWNNADGGREFDSSRCFIGEQRFTDLRTQLPPASVLLGLDEQTSCVLDFEADTAHVFGAGVVTIVRDGCTECCAAGKEFPLAALRRG
jgi:hypothetical protein